MLRDLFNVLVSGEGDNKQDIRLLLDGIGYRSNPSPLVLREKQTSDPDLKFDHDPSNTLNLDKPAPKWNFPVYQCQFLFVESEDTSGKLLSGIEPWAPLEEQSVEPEQPLPLIDVATLSSLLDELAIDLLERKQIDIKKLVSRFTALERIDKLPRMTASCYPERYNVLIDSIPALYQDIKQLEKLFQCLPTRLQPEQIWRTHASRFWHSILHKQTFNAIPESVFAENGSLLVVADPRSLSQPLRASLFNRQQSVIWLTPTVTDGCLYWGMARSTVKAGLAVDRLLCLLYTVTEFSRALVRKLRLQLGAPVSAEIDFWQHDDVSPDDLLGPENGRVNRNRKRHKRHLQAWSEKNSDQVKKLLKIIEDHLGHYSANIEHEYQLHLPERLVNKRYRERAIRYFCGLAVTLEQTPDEKLQLNLSACLLGLAERLTSKPENILATAIAVAQKNYLRLVPDAPVGVGNAQAWMSGAPGEYALAHSNNGLSIQPYSVGSGQLSTVFQLLNRSAIVDTGNLLRRVLPGEEMIGNSLVIHAHHTQIGIEQRLSSYFHWAESLEQSVNGLTLTTSQNLKIHYPSKPTDGPYPQIDSSEAPAWLDNEAIRLDQYGLSATLNIFGVEQIMRWIPPGRFTMGSPESEDGRSDDELVHDVALTDGFWLADTPCLQVFWKAVMGDNPGEFTGDNLPVDSVSWDMTQQFIDKVNSKYPALNLCLPSEAQWEYACRAGTRTPYSFGHQIDKSQANFNSESGLTNTTEVGRFPRNQWGLFDMHGNVWEWCNDLYGTYHEHDVVNPIGPEKGDYRVLRGGGWFSFARNCRSAVRGREGPSGRVDGIGFRFAHVDQPTAAKRQLKNTREGAEQARRSRKSRAASDGIFGVVKNSIRRDND